MIRSEKVPYLIYASQFELHREQLYREGHEAYPMKRTLVLFTLLSAAVTAQAASTSTPYVQNVRFAQESSPVNVVAPPKVLIHPAAVYTDEARNPRIEGDVIVQAYFDASGNVTVLKVVKGLGYGLDENAALHCRAGASHPHCVMGCR
jgi:hypothetical protein